LFSKGGDGHSLDAADGDPSDALFVDSNGNVGIGTTSPSALLDVEGKIISDDLSTKSLKTIIDTHSYSTHEKIRLNWSGESTTNGYVGTFLITMGGRGGHQQTAFATGILIINKAYNRAPEIRFQVLSGYGVYMEEEVVIDTQLVLDFHLNLSEHAKSHYSVLKVSGSVGISMDDSWSVEVEDDSDYTNGVGTTVSEGVFMNGNVGIGTKSPPYKLSVFGGDIAIQANNRIILYEHSDSRKSYIAYDSGNNRVKIIVDDYEALSLFDNSQYGGSVGIGETDPSIIGDNKLYVAGSAYSTVGWSASDERWKKNITQIEDSLDKVSQLQGVTYEWRVDEYPDQGFTEGKQIGLIAQDVEQVIPEIVHTNNDGYKSISYERLTAVLVEAIKELKAENEALRQEIQQIKEVIRGQF
jgi:hypothetical protein